MTRDKNTTKKEQLEKKPNNQKPIHTKVITYDGYRAFEKPKTIIFNNETFEICACETLFISTGTEHDAPIKRGFQVQCTGGAKFKLVLEEGAGWTVELLPGPRIV